MLLLLAAALISVNKSPLFVWVARGHCSIQKGRPNASFDSVRIEYSRSPLEFRFQASLLKGRLLVLK